MTQNIVVENNVIHSKINIKWIKEWILSKKIVKRLLKKNIFFVYFNEFILFYNNNKIKLNILSSI